MQRTGLSNVFVFLLISIGFVLQAPLTVSQSPAAAAASAPAAPVKKVFNPTAAKLAQQNYQPPPPTQAILTLSVDRQVVQPNESVQFKLQWNRTVVRANYHFDWGDESAGSDTTELAASHQYLNPKVYVVRVTATPIARAEMMVAKPSQTASITSNAVRIVVQAPKLPPPAQPQPQPAQPQPQPAQPQPAQPQPQPAQPQPQPATPLPPQSVALTANITRVNLNDPVSFTATLSTPYPAARFHFDFGDGNTVDAASNLAAHNYSLPGPHSATVTVADPNGSQQATSTPIEIDVVAPAPPPPVVQLTPLFQGPAVTGRAISVQALLNPPIRNRGFAFDWGDGTPVESVNAQGLGTHTYTTSGEMEVVVTAVTEAPYQPELQSSLPVRVSKSWWPPSGGLVAAAGGVLLAIGLAVWLMRKPDPPVPHTTPSNIVHQGFQYVAAEGTSVHAIRMAHPPSAIGPLKINSGMGQEEHRLKFTGHPDASN